MWRFPKLPFYAKFGAIPESYLIALSYEEQILWLCHQMSEFDEKLAKYFEDVKAYVEEVLDNLDLELDKKQDKLTAGDNIVIDENNVISAIVDPITYKYTPINGSYYNLDVPLGSEVSLTPIAGENTAHAFVEGIKQNDKFKIKGNYKAGIVDPQGNVLLHLEDQGYETFYAMTDGDLLVSWFNTDEVTPELFRYIGGNEIIERFEDDEAEINSLKRTTDSINGNVEGILNSYIEVAFDTLYNTNVPLKNSANLPLMDFVLRGNVRQDGTPTPLDPIIPIPVSGTHTLVISNGYSGEENNKEFTFHLGDIVLASSGTIQDTIQVDPNDNTRFRHFTYVGKIDSYNGETIEGEYISSTGGLDTGATIYYELPSNEVTSEVITSIQLHNELKALLETNIPRGDNTITFDSGVTTTKPHLSGVFRRVYYNVNNSVENNDDEIPTSGAVYRAIQGGGGGTSDVFYTTINQNVTLNADGSSNYNFEHNKYYYITAGHQIRYYDSDNVLNSATRFENSIFYYSEVTTDNVITQKVIYRTGVQSDLYDVSNASLYWLNDTPYWRYDHRDYTDYVGNRYSGVSQNYNSIPATGHDNDVPTIGAVRNYVNNYSTTEQRVGTWIDGKPIYKITLQDTLPNTNTDGNITEKQVDVSNLNIAMAVLVQGFIHSPAGNTMMFTNIENNSTLFEKCYCGTSNLVLGNASTARNGSDVYITIYYTKTTDNATNP